MEKGKTLKHLFQTHKGKLSDKWSLYLDEWDRLFEPYRNLPIDLLEIGIQNGGSLEVWGKYFQKAGHIVGVDIDENCGLLHFKDPRIMVIVGDANSDDSERRMIKQASGISVIIDDGSHKSSDIVRSFARYFPHLKEGGVYLVEDLHGSYWENFEGGLNNPLSAMSFFKRLTDIINNEHWRNDRSRREILARFESEFAVVFDELDLAFIHSIEFINSLCVIRKLSPRKNVLGRRRIVGNLKTIMAGFEDLNGSDIHDLTANIKDDTSLDIFELIDETNSLNLKITEREQAIQSLTTHAAEMMQSIQSLNKEAREKEWAIQALNMEIAEREQTIQSLSSQKAAQEQTIQTLEKLLAEQDEAVQALTMQLIEKVNLVNNLDQAVDIILHSTSWKISWPVRAVKSLMVAILNKVRTLVRGIGAPARAKRSLKKGREPAVEIPSFPRVQIVGGKKISVIVTSYNHESYIRQCLDSILGQKGNFNLEVVLGDDCSTDSTSEILQQYSQKYPGVFISLPAHANMGVTRNLKRCLDACTGDFIAICEGDDYWTDEHKLEKQMNFLEDHKDFSMCFSALLLYIEPENRFIFHAGQNSLNKEAITTAELIETNYIGNFSCCMYRADTVRRLPPELFDIYTVDWMFNMACGEIGKIGFIKDLMSVYRLHSQGAWSGKPAKEQTDDVLHSIDVYNSFFKNKYQEQFLRLKTQILDQKV